MRDIIEDQKRKGTKITTEDVLAIWRSVEEIQGLQNDVVFLEMGYQHFDTNGKPSTKQGGGKGWLHIIARHERCFAGRNNENIFTHLSNQVTGGSRHEVDQCTVYVIRHSGKILATTIVIGTKGFMVTARPFDTAIITNILANKLPEDLEDDGNDTEKSPLASSAKLFHVAPDRCTAVRTDDGYIFSSLGPVFNTTSIT